LEGIKESTPGVITNKQQQQIRSDSTMSTNANKNKKWEYSVVPTKSTMNQQQQQQRLYSTSNDNSNEEKYEHHRPIYNSTVNDIIQKYSSLNHNVADDDDAPDTPVRPGALDDYLNANSTANGVTIKATTTAAAAAARGGNNHALNATTTTTTTASIGSPDKTASTIVCIL
jgi:hypothetical protein